MVLASSDLGLDLLTNEQYKLGLKITAAVLNHIIPSGVNKDTSVVLRLSHSEQGLDLLAADDYKLAKQISKETLNHIMPTGNTLADVLACSSKGQAILAHCNNQTILSKLYSIFTKPIEFQAERTLPRRSA